MQRIIITETAVPALQRDAHRAEVDQIIFLDDLQRAVHGAALQPNSAELQAIWEQAYALAQQWYRSADLDPTLFQGVSLGAIIEIEMWYVWRSLLEDLAVLRRILEHYAPTSITLATYRNQRLAHLLAALGVTHVETRTPPRIAQIRRQFSRDQRTALFKTMELDRHVRLLALAARQRRIRPRLPQQHPIDTLALLELPGSYYAESLLPVLQHVPNSALLLMDPRHMQRAAQSGYPQLAFSSYVAPFLGRLAHDTLFWRKVFRQHRADLHKNAQVDGIDLWPAVAGRLSRVFALKLPLVAAEVRAAEALLQNHRVQSLLLVSDAHHGSRLITLVGRKLGVTSVVVQHGATFAPWGYIPLHADRFAAWGAISRQWMLDRGADPERVVITGQPRFDRLANRAPVERTTLGLPAQGRLLLWILDPFPIAENRAVLSRLATVLAGHPDLRLIIRPHPSMSDTAWLAAETAAHPTIQVSPATHNLHDIIACCDAVLTQGSTVGIEALALDRPVIIFPSDPADGVQGAFPASAVVHCATNEDLHVAMQHLFTQSDPSAELLNARRAFITDALYRLDGRSAERVAALITHHTTSSSELQPATAGERLS